MATINPKEPTRLTRVTSEGRQITYALTVIQQPERARACGSGAKSSADRRPVDPPPVVELRIYEGGDQKNDITFAYNANFFLFATLELARPMIHGRVSATPQQLPVLTGMPVSGMAYLDRPSEAGYFIFPDLSVRHEGKYKLSFNLYEETKDEKDKDPEPALDAPSKLNAAATPNESFDWRMEVKSDTFTVFSAKKFPGLAESTSLSRTVAEQGCRVRIRRDVRMRRRDGKATGDFDDMDEQYERSRRTATPDSVHEYRQRSSSNTSVDRQSYNPDPQRRPSAADYQGQAYAPGYTHPPAPHTANPGYNHLSFGSSPAHPYQAPQFAQPQPPISAQPAFHPPQPSYHAGGQYHQPPPPANYSYPERAQYQQYPPAPPPPSRENYEADYRRASVGYPSTSQQPSSQYAPAESNFGRSQSVSTYQPYGQRPPSPPINLAPFKLPSLKVSLADPKYDSHTSPIGPLPSTSRLAGPLPSPSYPDRYSQYSHPSGPEGPRNAKRSFDAVFSSASQNQPLHNGMRPTSSHHNQPSTADFDDDDEPVSMEAFKMQYRRADGTPYSRELPALE